VVAQLLVPPVALRCALGIVAVLVLTALAASGCISVNTFPVVEAAKGTGTARVYDKPYEVVWSTVVDAVKSSGLNLVSADPQTGKILAQRAVTAFSWGENVAIFVEDVGGRTRTRVEVVSKAALSSNVTAANWERRLFEDLDRRL